MIKDGRARDLRVLNAIAAELNRAGDVQQSLERTLRSVTRLLGLRTGWVWLLDPESGQFYNAASHNLPPYLQEPVRMAGSWCVCTDAFRQRKLTPQNIDVIECSRLAPGVKARALELTQGLQFHASIPLYSGAEPLGIMNVTGPAWRKLTPAELSLLSTTGYLVGIAIARARLTEESARLARSEERTRMAREIHDTLVQRLTGIGLQLEAALNHLERDASGARKPLSRALEVAREGLEEARRSVLGLRAAPLATKTLAAALQSLARGFTSETGIRVRLRIVGKRGLPEQVESELYRIAQEALTNVRKHASVNEAEITLRRNARSVTLAVRDRGRGVRRSRAGGPGQGIMGMRERARLLGGKLDIRSSPGRGATVTVKVPLEERVA